MYLLILRLLYCIQPFIYTFNNNHNSNSNSNSNNDDDDNYDNYDDNENENKNKTIYTIILWAMIKFSILNLYQPALYVLTKRLLFL